MNVNLVNLFGNAQNILLKFMQHVFGGHLWRAVVMDNSPLIWALMMSSSFLSGERSILMSNFSWIVIDKGLVIVRSSWEVLGWLPLFSYR